ncbi:YdeI/OmpD-associated family protein [Rhizobium sp. CC-YZS058]|uniref:YdeI/OmpD-associated family protein n=1 Tax=Rhizobium sp. CC-YZS058 TaxID=3042153 RepID=UPI002B05DD3F|nr:YdeI/OmpD-associated family protein [Rhizobium sp. CC-YZS058]MEA3536999.1 YdeI/OmpD-associated family protein [Rhizobium sp. CC-YZS058]
MTEMKAGLPVLSFPDADALEAWLGFNPEAPGLWIKFAKKKADVLPTLDKSSALDVALCHGWIDGQAATYDEGHFLMRFTPRRARSLWSQVNRVHVDRLVSEGRMLPGGLAQVEAAKADGRWEAAYASPSRIGVPDDVAMALSVNGTAHAAFEALGRSKRYDLLLPIVTVKRPDTRARKIAALVAALAESATEGE